MIYLRPRRAGKGQNESVYEVEDQVCPDQSIYTPIYRASLSWTEYSPDLEENGELGDEYKRTIEDFNDVIDLREYLSIHFLKDRVQGLWGAYQEQVSEPSQCYVPLMAAFT